MNEQREPGGIEWTRLPKGGGTFTRGFTWNPVAGCLHGCKWRMPDGAVAECYAKSVAERLASSAYPHWFEHHYWHPERLKEPLKVKEPAGIFLDSMSDLMGRWVPEEQVQAVLDVCRKAHWHTFMLLTKNAPRLKQFVFPPNVWVGVSSPPDYMFGKQLSRHQQRRMLETSLEILDGLAKYGHLPNITWMSFEPLSWDMMSTEIKYSALDWAVIGAASNGMRKYTPYWGFISELVYTLGESGVPIFFKGNLKSSEWARENWREDFPKGVGR